MQFRSVSVILKHSTLATFSNSWQLYNGHTYVYLAKTKVVTVQAVKVHGQVAAHLHSFLTSMLDRGQQSALYPSHLTPSTHQTKSWAHPKTCKNILENRPPACTWTESHLLLIQDL